jgi:hypothetical protein
MFIVPVRSRPNPMDPSAVSGRADPRVPIAGTAAYLSAERICIARAANVSLSGCFVETHNPDPIGTVAHMRLERGKEHVVVNVEVVRVSFCSTPDGRGAGMGMRFVDLSKEHRRFLARYVANAQRDQELADAAPFHIDIDVASL